MDSSCLAGLYYFATHVGGIQGEYGVALVRDGHVFSSLAFTSTGGMISVSAFTVCDEGQQVFVEVSAKSTHITSLLLLSSGNAQASLFVDANAPWIMDIVRVGVHNWMFIDLYVGVSGVRHRCVRRYSGEARQRLIAGQLHRLSVLGTGKTA